MIKENNEKQKIRDKESEELLKRLSKKPYAMANIYPPFPPETSVNADRSAMHKPTTMNIIEKNRQDFLQMKKNLLTLTANLAQFLYAMANTSILLPPNPPDSIYIYPTHIVTSVFPVIAPPPELLTPRISKIIGNRENLENKKFRDFHHGQTSIFRQNLPQISS